MNNIQGGSRGDPDNKGEGLRDMDSVDETIMRTVEVYFQEGHCKISFRRLSSLTGVPVRAIERRISLHDLPLRCERRSRGNVILVFRSK